MQVFTDNRKRRWTVVLDVAAVRRVKAMLGVDLMDALSSGFTRKLAADPALLSNLLYILCEKEAAARAVSDRKFAAAISGIGIAAYCAFIYELVEFFPGDDQPDTPDQPDVEKKEDRGACTPCTPEDCWSLVWQHAGVLGIDPGPFSLRELCLMARARKKDAWSRTSALIAKIHNMFCESKVALDYFNPFVRKEEEKRVVDTPLAFRMMKELLCGGGK